MKDQQDQQDQLELRRFYSEQRDSQLRQLNAINAQGTFSLIAAIVGLLIGGLTIDKKPCDINIAPTSLYILGTGILLLLLAAVIFSKSYTSRIAVFEKLVVTPTPKTPNKLSKEQKEAFEIKPNNIGNHLVFFGVLFMLMGTFLILKPLLIR